MNEELDFRVKVFFRDGCESLVGVFPTQDYAIDFAEILPCAFKKKIEVYDRATLVYRKEFFD